MGMAADLVSAVQAAAEEAEAAGAHVVGTEHLILGALRQKENRVVRRLTALGLTYESIRETYIQIIAKAGLTRSDLSERVSSAQYTPRATVVLQLAQDMVTDKAGVSELLVAVLLHQQAVGTELLRTTARRLGLATFQPIVVAREALTLLEHDVRPARCVDAPGGLVVRPVSHNESS